VQFKSGDRVRFSINGERRVGTVVTVHTLNRPHEGTLVMVRIDDADAEHDHCLLPLENVKLDVGLPVLEYQV
jgi:hypothetical protein